LRVLATSMHISLYFQQPSANCMSSLSLDFKRLGDTVVQNGDKSLTYNALLRYHFNYTILPWPLKHMLSVQKWASACPRWTALP